MQLRGGGGRGSAGQNGHCADADRRITELARAIIDGFASMTVDDVRRRYAIGKVVLSLGAEAVSMERLAETVGCSAKALYQYAVVVKRFSEDELNHWLSQRNICGQPPTWSHFVLLCSVSSRSRRAAVLEEWLAKPIGIRELAARLRPQSGVEAEAAGARP